MKTKSANQSKSLAAVLGAALLLTLLVWMLGEGAGVGGGAIPVQQPDLVDARLPGAFAARPPSTSPIVPAEQVEPRRRRVIPTRASIRGRAVLGELPLSGVHVILSAGEGFESVSVYTEEWTKRMFGAKTKSPAPWLAMNYTDAEGIFSLRNLEPGTYTLDAFSREPLDQKLGRTDLSDVVRHVKRDDSSNALLHVKRKCTLVAGEEMDLGDLKFFQGMENLILAARAAVAPAIVQIDSGQPGLTVRTFKKGGARPGVSRSKTDANGKARLLLMEDDPVRIDLADRTGKILGSTDSFLRYPRGLETAVSIPAVPGGLTVYLPPNSEVLPGQTVQFTLTRTGSLKLDILIKTVDGDHPVKRERFLKTSEQGIEYTNLRHGHYQVKAIRKLAPAGGGWPIATGKWMVGEASVFSGQVSHCNLK